MATFVATLNGLRARLGVRDRRRDRGTRLLIEALEDRRLLSVSPLAQAAASLVLRPNFNTSALTAGAAHSAVLLDPAAAAAQIAAHPHPSALPAAAEIAKGTVPFSPNENWDSPLLVASPTVKAAATPGIAASGAASSATVYSTGFESSEGFTAGFLGTQNGWNTFAGDATQPAVAVGSPFDGSQYLQVGNDAKVAAGGLVGGFSPDFGSQSAGTYVVSANLLVNQPTNPLKFMGGSNYYVAVLGDSQGDITADICFYHELNQGYVFVLTNVGSQVQWTYTGWTWGPDSPIQVTIAIDATTNQINYYGNGYALFRGAVWSIPAAEQIVLYDDNLNSADGVTAAYDDLDVSRTLLIPARAAAWWDDKIVVSNTTGTNTDDVLYPSDSLYVDWAVKNVGDAPAAAFWTSVYVDGAPEKTWQTPAGVLSGDFFTVTDFDLGPLAVGIHQIAIIPDTTADGVAPADAWLNEYVKSITVNPFGEIQGTIWNDANANGTWDSGETAASGATVYLDLNHNGLRDPGEPSTTTDANGSYTFTGLRDGNYVVAVDSGSQSSYQENGTGYPSGAVGTSTATVAAGQVSHLPPVGVPFVLQGRLAESRSAGVGATAGAASAKGTVPFSSNENWDSPPLAPAPASFDLRTLNDVTPIEDQGALGGCWAFATYAALESAILVEGGPATTFSENNLKDYHRFDYWPNGGGFDVNMSRAYLSRGSGPINASDSPYYDWDDMPAPGGTPQYYVRDSLTFDTPERIKQALMTYGALTTDMYFDSSAFNASDNTYYYSGSQEANHAVAIVGWDDNKVTAAAAPGAWLIKNSWGAAWGDRGYFWISYSDTVAAQTATAYINAVPASSYDHIYYYDEYGEVEDINATDAFNAFTAGSSQDLKSVQFYTTADNAGYQVNVYSSFSGGVLSGLLGTVSGTCDDPGYHTVDLPSQVPLAAGQKFYVALHLDNGGQFPMAISMKLAGYSSNATSQPGESYYFDAGQWTDLATFDPTANLTIKALTVDAADPGTLAVSLAPGAQATAQNLGVSPPPTATLSNSGPVNMGGTATVSFSQPTDPSATAAAAGFHYAYAFTSDGRFDIGDGTYAGSVTAASATVPAADLADGPATLLVHARIIDQDGRFTDYTTTITILYVAPTAVNDSYNTLENVPLSVTAAAGVLANDYEPGGYTLSMAPVTLPAHGQLHWAADGAFTYQPNQYFSGADSFTYQAVDGVGRSNVARVTINVTPVNQAPSFTPGGNVTVKEDSGPQTIASWAASISAGPPNESWQTAAFLVSNNNPGLFAAQPAVSPTGGLSFTPALYAHGTATVTLRLKDNGGTANGGVDTSAARTFTITIAHLYQSFEVLAVGADASLSGRPMVQVYDTNTGALITQFLAYEPSYHGGVRVALGDVNGDGSTEIITAPGLNHAPQIKVFDLSGHELTQFRFNAYAAGFIDGVQLAVGDFNGDGLADIATVPSFGPAEVRVFDNQLRSNPAQPFSSAPARDFRAFAANFMGGGTIAAADLNGDGRAELVVGSGPGMTATIAEYDVSKPAASYTPLRTIIPFGTSFRGGVSVAVAGTGVDPTPDILAAAGSSGGSQIRTYSAGGALLASTTAFSGSSSNAPVRAVAKSSQANGQLDAVFAAQGPGGRTQQIRHAPLKGQYLDWLLEHDPDFQGGFFLA